MKSKTLVFHIAPLLEQDEDEKLVDALDEVGSPTVGQNPPGEVTSNSST
ncbi:hypothetical protein P0R31_27655 [Bradyrhizobium yuanmingense]|nr:hypothetical protein [Bradyrhizobium yuanmingense]MDF0521026.1 hypothetical protein [Bradyrhizobium yuanmingense]